MSTTTLRPAVQRYGQGCFGRWCWPLLRACMLMLLGTAPASGVFGQSAVIDSPSALVADRPISGTLADTVLVRRENKIGAAHPRAGRVDSGLVQLHRSVGLLEAMDDGARNVTWYGLRSIAWKFMGQAHMIQDDPPAALEAYRRFYLDTEIGGGEPEFQRDRDAILAEERMGQERARASALRAALAVVVASALLYLIRRIHRSARSLREANEELLRAQRLLIESERQREAEKVRTNIARDVHDQLGSDLTKLVMLSSEARAIAHEDTPSLPAIVNDIERIASEANRSLGDIVWAIDPHHDSLADLTDRIRAHGERMLKGGRVAYSVDCVHTGPDRSLDPATKRDIYLILREALNNAVKYAKAQRIDVRFHTSARQVRMEVEDDGVGMVAVGEGGNGLTNMRSRAQRIGAELTISGPAGSGTTIRMIAGLADEGTV